MASDAIGLDVVSRVVGYILKKGNFATSTPNLPQRIVILGEANHDNQGTLDVTPKEITSAKQAGQLYGYGSPIHVMMRILRPFSGLGVGSIPTIVIPQAAAGGAAAKVITVAVTGVATGNGTHYLKIAGRDNIDGNIYALNIEDGDTIATVHQKIEDCINNVLSCPMSADSTQYIATLTSKWRGLTANDLTVSVDTGDDDLGLSYAIVSSQAGSGTPSIATALAAIGNEWATWLLSGYNANVSAILDALEAHNGIALDQNPTGRYSTTNWKPLIALCGSVADDPSTITDARDVEMTIALCVAPLSKGLPMEAAANYCYLAALNAQNSPHLDIVGQYLPDMPTPTDIGSMSDFATRDLIVKKGCSTVALVASKYQVQDFVTTYHPDGEQPPQFRHCRSLVIDMNVRYAYFLNEQTDVVDHAIAADDAIVTATKVIKPKQWKGRCIGMFTDLETRALITDTDFSTESLTVETSQVNPDRFETFFRYKRTGFVRQAATTAEAVFNFGTITV